MSVPKQKPGRSKQDYGTPRVFLDALEKRFGQIDVDLAATHENKVTSSCLTPAEDSLAYHWASSWPNGNLWLNPPFEAIGPWAEKCAAEVVSMRRGRIFLLTPASIGTNWFARHVLGQAMVLGLSPRLQFEGTTAPYPKDLCLSVYSPEMHGFGCWRWDR